MGRTKVAKTLNWSKQSQEDIAAILDFYDVRNGDSGYSDQLLRKFQERMNDVIANPYLGERWKKSVFRFVVAKPFQLFYRVTKTEIIVAAVWDSRRNPKTLKLTR